MKILIVEDDAVTAHSAEAALRVGLADCATRLATDGKSAMECFDTDNPDLVLLDLGLPDMDGIDVCRRIREVSRVPIIILSARDSEQDIIAGLADGADDYVVKPFSSLQLIARIQAVMRRWQTDTYDNTESARPLSRAAAEMDLSERVIQYLRNHLEGADIPTLIKVAMVSKRQVISVVGKLIDSHTIVDKYPLFFAAQAD
jgi:two-component system response regulator RegX3